MNPNGIAPIAWLNSRSYSKILRTLAAGGQDAIELTAKYVEALGSVVKRIELADKRVLAKHVITLEIARERGVDKLDIDKTRVELRMVQPLHAFLDKGRQVFEFSDDLVAELKKTDVDDVRPCDLGVPYDAFYLRLPDALPPISGVPIEGILVQNLNYQDAGPCLVLDFLPPFTTADETADALMAMPIAILPLTGDTMLGNEINASNWRMITPGHMEKTAHDLGVGHAGEDWYERSLQHTRRRYASGVEYVQANLPLIVNALLFIDNCRTEQIMGWSSDAPQALVGKATADVPGARKAEQKLIQAGWAKVTLCQTAQNPQGEPLDSGERTVRAHWRRGHWRRQHHGPGNGLIRLIRIRPTMVGTGPAAEGRTYQAKLAPDYQIASQH